MILTARIRNEGPVGELRRGVIPVVLDDDRLARYGIYVLREDSPHRVAECELEGIGLCLVTLAAERDDVAVFGVLDQERRRWISGLWQPKEEE